MRIRRWVGRRLDAAIGRGQADRVRALERRVRDGAARRIAVTQRPARPAAPTPVRRRPVDPEPFVAHPNPTMGRYELLQELHMRLRPRTYLEIGVRDGGSLMLSRTRSIGVDPEFAVVKELECAVQLVRATSDDFFARPDPISFFEGLPVDLVFIDGMHWAEFALRDFMNAERHVAPTGVVVLDDVLPRNVSEAARERRTGALAGDVYK